ncbi:hypothetical protein Ocin01_00011 [Orchesella cincta]|uniref:Uncharacterized protein n=1 Tax=Orchesella cincta TaxID=48709 RepID=A0A1D2NN31_ORCCI|nr:hypothetical protein Ocin01_00011 [Orchesella cincta]
MSKTATLAYTRYGKKEDTAINPAHHLINQPTPVIPALGNDKGSYRTENRSKVSSSRTEGYRLGETKLDMNRRGNRSVLNNTTLETSRTKNQKPDKSSSNRKISIDQQAATVSHQKVGRANDGKTKSSRNETAVKISLEDFFKQQGADLHKVKRNCKIYNKEEWEGGQPRKGGLYLSTFSPPSGFSREDVPESQGMSQPEEQPISPAVAIAYHQHKEREMRRRRKASEGDDCSDVLQKLKDTRRANQNKALEVIADEKVADNKIAEEHNVTFPEDDSFSDSLLIRATQQVEGDAGGDGEGESSGEWLHNEENRDVDRGKRDINGNNRKATSSDESHAPFTSTPIPELGVRKLLTSNETPKSRVSGTSRTRNRSSGKSTSLFESSDADLELKLSQSDETEETPRKLLKFDGSPIKIGDFEDDDDDVIFSQIVLPEEKPESVGNDNIVNNKTTLVVSDNSGNEIDSFLNPGMFSELDKLEGMAIYSSKSSSSSMDYKNNSNSSMVAPPTGSFDEETPRTRSRRIGLSRRRAKK